MDAATTVHPTDQTLQAYGLGQLDDQVAEAVSRHLDGCPDCLRRVAGLSSDSFLGRLRQAESPNGSAAGRTTPVGPSPTGHAAPPGAPRTAGTLPAELAEHPDYEIVRELGHGGMGVVFLAHNQIMGRDEVLKVIGRDIIERPGVLDRFLREIRAVARLQHPNIVTAYSAFRAGGSLVLAMEYVEGLDLGRMVKVKGPMPVGNACSFVYQAALGLQHAHEAGMVHRDIKPGNLMLTHEGGRAAIKVLDFGLAKAGREQGMLDFSQPGEGRELNSLGDLTLAGQMLGTPDFIAPEQISDAQKADIRADIYSLGCTLYYVLSGRAPFEAATLYDILQAHHSMDARLLNFVRPEVPAELAALVAKMMAKEPHRRFQTPSEVAKALAPFFKKRTAASVSQNLGVDPVLAPVAGPAASDPTQPGPDAVAVPASAPETGPGMWTSLIEFKETQGDADAVAGEAKPARERPRWLWPAVAASVGFAAVLFGAVAVNLRAHKDRGKSGTSLPAHNITVMPDGARETIDSPEPNRRAVAANNDSLVSSGPVEKIAAENPKTDRSSMAEVKLEGVPAKAPSPDPRRETDRRKAKENLQAEPGQEIAGVEKGASGPLKLAPKKVNKSMRWADSVYILDAEDDVRQAAAAVRYEEYRRAFLDLASLKANQADRKAWLRY